MNGFWSMKKTLQSGPEEGAGPGPANRQIAPNAPSLSLSSSATGSPMVAAKTSTSSTRKARPRAEVTTICLVRKSQAGLSS